MPNRAGFISQTQKDQILNAIDLVQLIGEYVLLKPSGKNFVGLCPFHQEKTPSFFVSPSYQNYKCYGCGESGDAIRFVMGIENLPFVEALGHLAKRSGIKLDTPNLRVELKKTEADACLEQAFLFFRENLSQAEPASDIRQYLEKRSISRELIEQFELGCVNPGWTNLKDYLEKKSFSESSQEKAGLIKKGDRGGFYDRLRNRLIFPIRDKSGRLVGFAGRALGEEEPKYLNPPETQLYKKSSIFYGIHLAHSQIRRKRKAILVEGYLDAIRLHEQGWVETIATCGTAITENHVNLLKSYGTEEVYLVFDGDDAGIKAAERSAVLFIENDLDSKVVILPEGLDPDDYFKKYTNLEFKALMENAAYDFEFVISRTRQSFSSKGIQFRETRIKEVIELTERIGSPIKKDLFLSRAAKEFDVNKLKLQKLIRRPGGLTKPSKPLPGTNLLEITEKQFLPEVKFLQYLINHVESIELAREKITPSDFIHQELSEIYARFLQLDNNEFGLLSPKDFPEQFVEFSTLIMKLLHVDTEYRGPTAIRPGSKDMQSLREEHEKLTEQYSEDALNLLMLRLKKNKKAYDIKKLKYSHPEEVKKTVQEFVKVRKDLRTEETLT